MKHVAADLLTKSAGQQVSRSVGQQVSRSAQQSAVSSPPTWIPLALILVIGHAIALVLRPGVVGIFPNEKTIGTGLAALRAQVQHVRHGAGSHGPKHHVVMVGLHEQAGTSTPASRRVIRALTGGPRRRGGDYATGTLEIVVGVQRRQGGWR